MDREEVKVGNPGASLRISVGFKCATDLYGNLCVTSCNPNETREYRCSSLGEKICKRGWKGPACLERDVCHDFACAKSADCVSILDGPKCFCNGTIGPECYPNYNPCTPISCQNGGKCVQVSHSSSDISCQCKFPYVGHLCETRTVECEINPCKNNGSCVNTDDGSFVCNCTADFVGVLCEDAVYATVNTTISASSSDSKEYSKEVQLKKMSFAIVLGVLSLLFLIVVGIFCLIRWTKKMTVDNEKEVPIFLKHVSLESQVKGRDVLREETVYDTLEERATYAGRMADNEDYLVQTVFNSTLQSSSEKSETSSYIPMSSDNNLNTSVELLLECAKEEDNLPALPMRNTIKKH